MANAAPVPLLSKNEPVDWFFAFKFNSATFPGGTVNGKDPVGTEGMFGGVFLDYKSKKQMRHGQQYAVASSKHPTLVKNNDDCIGTSENDPLGATFAQVYFSDDLYYIIWNDQLYNHPGGNPDYPLGIMDGDSWTALDIPWGHSKGMLAWDNEGNGFVLQVTTPSWPGSGNKKHPRKDDGNTLGSVIDDNVEVSQHFFCLKINATDLEIILKALNNASVVTDPTNPQLARIGGPQHIKDLAGSLGKLSSSMDISLEKLSSGVQLISKPSLQNCPPWQIVSAKLGGLPLLVATWWNEEMHAIYTTNEHTVMHCWPGGDFPKPGPVEIAVSGKWHSTTIGLKGSASPNGNHAKIGVSTDERKPISIFGDMNQMGALIKMRDDARHHNPVETCAIHQNGRGGLFFVVENQALYKSIKQLISNEVAGTHSTKTSPPTGQASPVLP